MASNNEDRYERATFAGGCFWCMVPPFEHINGVKQIITGYTGGTKENPTYDEVSGGATGHFEAVEITFDPSLVTYERLLAVFWRQIDPTDPDGQFTNRGPQYRTAIFYHSPEQKAMAEQSMTALQQSGRFLDEIVTEILPAGKFYPAEGVHQGYHKQNRAKYKAYRQNSGRDLFIRQTWGAEAHPERPHRKWMDAVKPSDGELKSRLTALQYEVTQKNETEPAFDNEYADNKREGIYVDIVSGEPLFSSLDKYDSGTGWPSFTEALEYSNIVLSDDSSFFKDRTEVKSAHAGSHLGHLFKDGPEPTGDRYCMNSAALRFVSKEDLEKEGYGEYLELFE